MTCTAARMVPDLDGRHHWFTCVLEAGHDGPHEARVTW
jgi:hypothetical protein